MLVYHQMQGKYIVGKIVGYLRQKSIAEFDYH